MNLTTADIASLTDKQERWSCHECIQASGRGRNRGNSSTLPSLSSNEEPVTVVHFNKLLAELKGIRDAQNEILLAQDQLRTAVGRCNDLLDIHSADLTKQKSDMVEVRKDISGIRQSHAALQEKVEGLAGAAIEPSVISMEEFLDEAAQRHKRRCNLMLFGVPENDNQSRVGLADKDTWLARELLQELLQEMGLPADSVIITLERLGGRRTESSNPRPIRVVMDSANTVDAVLKKTSALKDNPRFKKVHLSRDQTPRQLRHYKDLREQIKVRARNGENGLRIRYVRGVPKIVNSLNKQSPTE